VGLEEGKNFALKDKDPVVLALGESAGGGVTREAVILGISLGF